MLWTRGSTGAGRNRGLGAEAELDRFECDRGIGLAGRVPGPRGSASRKSDTHSLPHSVEFGLSPTPEALRRWANRPAVRRTAKALPICFRPQPVENEYEARAEYFGPPHPGAAGRPLTRGLSYSLSAQLSAHSSSDAPPSARLRRSLRSEDGDSERNRATRSQFKRSKPAGFGVEAGSKRRCASLRGGRLRPARPVGSQEQHLVHRSKLSGSSLTYSCSSSAVSATSSVELQSAAWGGGELRGSKSRRSIAQGPANGTAQSSSKSTAQFCAPCQPHCGSAVAPPVPLGTRKIARSIPIPVARWDFISILLSQNERNPSLGGRATDFCSKSRFFARLARFIYIRLPPK